MNYEQTVKWGKKHRKGTRQPVIMSTGSGFWPSGTFLKEDYWPYLEKCKTTGKKPMGCEEYYKLRTEGKMPRGRVKAHPRRTAGGKVANVREHGRKVKPGLAERPATRKMRGNIEDETMVLPYACADGVLHEVEVYLQKKGMKNKFGKKLQKELGAFLEDRAQRCYKSESNERWANSLKGEGGPAILRQFMRHWLAGELGRKHPEILRVLPEGFKTGESIL